MVLAFIESQIKQFDDFYKNAEIDSVNAETTSRSCANYAGNPAVILRSGTHHLTILGSKQKTLTIEEVLEDKGADPAFTSFCSRVSLAIQVLSSAPADTIAINDSHRVRVVCFINTFHYSDLTNYIQITEYQLVKVEYESVVDWRVKMDYLRCNPKFHGRPRYDFVIANLPRGCIFAQLAFVFVCRVNEHDYHLAIIQPLEKVTRPSTKDVDKKLSIYRWKIRARDRCEVIPLDCIVRGAVLVGDTKFRGDYFIIDTLDDDMFLRVKKI